MNGHLDQWLDAHLDGELTVSQQRQAEAHLSVCRRCQELLQQRRDLSAMLQLVPQAQDLKTEARFAAEIGLQLNRRPQDRLSPVQELSRWVMREPLLRMSWLAVPIVLLLNNAFIQAAAVISQVLDVIPGYHQGFLEQLSLVQSSFGLPLNQPYNAILNNAGLFNWLGWDWLAGQAALIALSFLYLAWLAAWLVYKRNTVMQTIQKANSGRL